MARPQTRILLSLAFLFTAHCKGPSQSSPGLSKGQPELEKIISDRPQKVTNFQGLIKLKSPPLFATATQVKGITVVDEALKAQILAEQETAIKALIALSPSVKIIYKYRFVLNGLAISAPANVIPDIKDIPNISILEKNQFFGRPRIMASASPSAIGSGDLAETNSVSYIGGLKVQNELAIEGEDGATIAVDGTGIRVGIIDTGIDYTHAMLGGSGDPEAYKAIDPTGPSELFPNAKVLGGIDLVGSNFSPGSKVLAETIPVPDVNPIDESGHGTHVAGTVAGIGDGIQTYSGVAPGAKLHAIKVFGKDSTTDSVVIAGLEYAADPDGDLDPSDQLHVVNLSLGSSYGQPRILYSEAIKNLVAGGTLVVASAGNSGDKENIVGAPGTSTEAISVAAARDHTEHNWKFPAVRFSGVDSSFLSEGIEAAITKPIAESGSPKGPLVYAGTAQEDFSEELKSQIKGKVAFIDRGGVAFTTKISKAFDAGAIAVVVANNVEGSPIVMGGDQNFTIPGIMVSLSVGNQIKAALESGSISIEFQTNEFISKPELIGTITDFSSKGPRSIDSLIKPEITAPGSMILSAKMGSGAGGVKMSGTSMSSPHVAGVMALLKQYRSFLSSEELKSLLINSAIPTSDVAGQVYDISRQGSGMARAYEAALAPLTMTPSTISLGEVSIERKKLIRRNVTITNHSEEIYELAPGFEGDTALRLLNPQPLVVTPGETIQVQLSILLSAPASTKSYEEFSGWVLFKNKLDETQTILRAPILAIANRTSRIDVNELIIYSASVDDQIGAAADLKLTNLGRHPGDVWLFNQIGVDNRKVKATGADSHKSRSCDLERAGYRIIQTADGESKLQVGVKLYNPVTHWQNCEISVQIDTNGDKLAEQEFVGIPVNHLGGLETADAAIFKSLLLNATKVRKIRKDYETNVALGGLAAAFRPNYLEAIEDVQEMISYNHGTVAIIETKLAMIRSANLGQINIKIGVLHWGAESIESDDFLLDKKAGSVTDWTQIHLNPNSASYVSLPEKLRLAPGEAVVVPMTKGEGNAPLLVLLPQNASNFSEWIADKQSVTPESKYAF